MHARLCWAALAAQLLIVAGARFELWPLVWTGSLAGLPLLLILVLGSGPDEESAWPPPEGAAR